MQPEGINASQQITIPREDLSVRSYQGDIERDEKKSKERGFERYGEGAMDCLNALEQGRPFFVDDILDAGKYFLIHDSAERAPRALQQQGRTEELNAFLQDRDKFFELIADPKVINELNQRVRECRTVLFESPDSLERYLASEDLLDISLIIGELSQRYAAHQDETDDSDTHDEKSSLQYIIHDLNKLPLELYQPKKNKWDRLLDGNLEVIKSTNIETFFNFQYPEAHITEFIRQLVESSESNMEFLTRKIAAITDHHIWPNIIIHNIRNTMPEYKGAPAEMNLRTDIPNKASLFARDLLRAYPKIHNSVLERYSAVMQGILGQIRLNEQDDLPVRHLFTLLPYRESDLSVHNIPLWGDSRHIANIKFWLSKVIPIHKETDQRKGSMSDADNPQA